MSQEKLTMISIRPPNKKERLFKISLKTSSWTFFLGKGFLLQKSLIKIGHLLRNYRSSNLLFRFTKVLYRSLLLNVIYIRARLLQSCRTKLLFAVFSKIGALDRNAYWFHVLLIFIVIFDHSSKLDVRA